MLCRTVGCIEGSQYLSNPILDGNMRTLNENNDDDDDDNDDASTFAITSKLLKP